MDPAFGNVDLQCQRNNSAHRTNDISEDRLIVRRGQDFLITLKLNHPYKPAVDTLQLTVETGPEPSEALGTRCVFRIPEGHGRVTRWKARLHESSVHLAGTVIVAITSPADAPIGEYVWSVKTNENAKEGISLGKMVLLFNPWCQEDWVHLPEEEERQEYVMAEQGILYKGSDRYIGSRAWDFGQFEEDIVDICLKLLDVNPKCLKDAPEDFSARCNPIYVSRVISAMINANDDRGVLSGRWDGNYEGGVTPTRWDGSVEILRKWIRYGCHPVKYGQCWVFAGVMATVLRCLGIPCRVVTNFQSAHDTDKNLIIDDFFSDDGVQPKESPDSVWNYHVWVEAWMRRPDMSGESVYDGWQVVDPTPQEKSTGVYCCGPCPVKAILQGQTHQKYDVPFVFAEVNADRITWLVARDGSKKRILSDTLSVGQSISTKSVGRDKRLDITNTYKYKEGTTKERNVFNLAVTRNNEHMNGDHDHTSPTNPTIPTIPTIPTEPSGVADVVMKVVERKVLVSGGDISLDLVLSSADRHARSLVIRLNVQAMRYTGVPASQIYTSLKEETLQPNQGYKLIIPFLIPFSVYGKHMLENNSIKVSAVATDQENKENVYFTEKDIVPQSPLLTIRTLGPAQQHKDLTVEVEFANPLPEPLIDCTISVTASGILRKTEEARLAVLKPGHRVRVQMTLIPYRAGHRKLVADFDCTAFRDIKASCNVDVKNYRSYFY